MADVLIRNIDQETLDRLKARADFNNRSLQEELKELLEDYSGVNRDKSVEIIREIQERYKASGRIFPDSVDMIREDRER